MKRNRKSITAIFALSAVFAVSALAQAQTSSGEPTVKMVDPLPLHAGKELVPDTKYFSSNRNFYLRFEVTEAAKDNNLVVRRTADDGSVWELKSFAASYKESQVVKMQSDGNFVVYGASNKYIWSALSKNPEPGSYLTLTDSGVLQLKSGKTHGILWNSPPPLFSSGGNGERQSNEILGKVVNLEVIFVDWSDHPKDTQASVAKNEFDSMWKSLTSDGTLEKAFLKHGITIKANLNKAWKRMPQPMSFYFPEGEPWKWQAYVPNSRDLLGEGADFAADTVAVIVAPESAGAKFAAGSGAHGISFRNIQKMITIAPAAYGEHYTTLMHEIGHTFGAGDTYPMSAPFHHKIGAYDMMADIVYATGFMGWTRYRNGWMGAERVKYLTEKGDYTIDLKKLSATAGTAMVVVVTGSAENGKYWVIEIGQDVVSREQFKAGSKEKLNTEGERLIVYGVTPTTMEIVARSKISEPAKHGTTVWLDETSYLSEQSSNNPGLPFELSVGAKTEEGFTITVKVK